MGYRKSVKKKMFPLGIFTKTSFFFSCANDMGIYSCNSNYFLMIFVFQMWAGVKISQISNQTSLSYPEFTTVLIWVPDALWDHAFPCECWCLLLVHMLLISHQSYTAFSCYIVCWIFSFLFFYNALFFQPQRKSALNTDSPSLLLYIHPEMNYNRFCLTAFTAVSWKQD